MNFLCAMSYGCALHVILLLERIFAFLQMPEPPLTCENEYGKMIAVSLRI